MRSLFIIRGIPGSGKTTVANMLSGVVEFNTPYPVYSADMFFEKDGEYKFDPTKLPEAHKWCVEQVESSMESCLEKIFVANTFVQKWEFSKYEELAEKHGYTIFSLIVENRHGNKNVHNVPDEKIEQMKKKFDIQL